MKKIILFPIIFILLINTLAVAAQNIISGKITDSKNEPIDLATVILQTSDSVFVEAVYSDSLGNFSFKNSLKDFRILVQHILYKPYSQIFTNQTFLNIILEIRDNALEEVVVEGQRPLLKIENGILAYNMPVLLASNQASNAYEAILALPGVREDKENVVLAGANALTILINGKPTTMTQEQVIQLLKAMPAAQIDKAEVMYSAPPQYHAGNGAAINIVIKHSENKSFSGQANATYAQRTFADFNSGISLFYNNSKIYSDFLYNFSTFKVHNDFHLKSNHTVDNQLYNIIQDNIGIYKETKHSIRAGIDYELSENQSISAIYTVQISPFEKNSQQSTSNSFPPSTNTTDNIKPTQMHNIALNYNAQKIGFTVGADYTFYQINTLQTFNHQDVNSFTANTFQRIGKLMTYVDKSHNLKNNWTVGYGTKFDFANTKSAQIYDENSGKTGQNTDSEQNEYSYDLYFRVSKSFSQQFNLKASITGEYYRFGNYKRINFFPNLGANFYSKDYQNIVQFDFAAQKVYPSYWETLSSTAYLNDYSVVYGNPNLLPYNQYSVNLSYILKQKYSLTLFYFYADKYFVQLPYQSTTTKNLIYQTTNEDFMYQTGIQATVPFTKKWYDTQVVLYGIFQRAKDSHFHDIAYDKSKFIFYSQWTNNFTFWQKPLLKFYIEGNVMTRALQGLGEIPAVAWLSSGLKLIFADKRAEINLRANNIFKSMPSAMDVNYEKQNLYFWVFQDQRYVSLSATYKFGGNVQQKERKEVDTSRFGTK